MDEVLINSIRQLFLIAQFLAEKEEIPCYIKNNR